MLDGFRKSTKRSVDGFSCFVLPTFIPPSVAKTQLTFVDVALKGHEPPGVV